MDSKQHPSITIIAIQGMTPALPVSGFFAKKPRIEALVVVVVLDDVVDVPVLVVVMEDTVVEVVVDEPVVVELWLVVDEMVVTVAVMVALVADVLVKVMVGVHEEVVVVVEIDTVAEVTVVVVVGGRYGMSGPFSHHHFAFPELTLAAVPAPLLFRMCSISPWPSRHTDSGDSNEFSSHGGTAMPR